MGIEFNAGEVIKLTAVLTVVIGELVEVEHHPSGSAFNGLGVVVAAFNNAAGFAVTHVVALNDPTHRKVVRIVGRPEVA